MIAPVEGERQIDMEPAVIAIVLPGCDLSAEPIIDDVHPPIRVVRLDNAKVLVETLTLADLVSAAAFHFHSSAGGMASWRNVISGA